jgi:hypothetical protein
MKYKKWTRQEIDYLKENYGKIPVKKIAETLLVTKRIICYRANKSNLKSHLRIKSYGMLGKHHSEETKRKMSLAHMGKIGKKSSNWKGNKAKYSAIHYWIREHKPKSQFCEECKKKKRLTIANISKQYLRNPDDYKWLCYSCHSKFDFPNGVRGINLKK